MQLHAAQSTEADITFTCVSLSLCVTVYRKKTE